MENTIELGRGMLGWTLNEPVDGYGAVRLAHPVTAPTAYADFADAPTDHYGELVAVLLDEGEEVQLGEGVLFVDVDEFARPLIGVRLVDEPGLVLDGALCDRTEGELVRLELRIHLY